MMAQQCCGRDKNLRFLVRLHLVSLHTAITVRLLKMHQEHARTLPLEISAALHTRLLQADVVVHCIALHWCLHFIALRIHLSLVPLIRLIM